MTYLTGVTALSGMKFLQSDRDQPDNLFPYLAGSLNSLSAMSKLVYAEFDSDTLRRRRDPKTNDTLYNIDKPRFGMTPLLNYRMVGSRTHIDASLVRNQVIHEGPGIIGESWSGIWWRWVGPPRRAEGIQLHFKTLHAWEVKETDRRFLEFFW